MTDDHDRIPPLQEQMAEMAKTLHELAKTLAALADEVSYNRGQLKVHSEDIMAITLGRLWKPRP